MLATGVRVSTFVDVDAFSSWIFVEVFVAVVAVALVSAGVVLAFAIRSAFVAEFAFVYVFAFFCGSVTVFVSLVKNRWKQNSKFKIM